jgi:hypothetical protein
VITDGQVEIHENEHTASPCPATGDSNVACIRGSRAAERRLSITRLRFIFACVRLPLVGNKYQEWPRGGLSHPFIGLRGVALAIALTAGPHRCGKYFSTRGEF